MLSRKLFALIRAKNLLLILITATLLISHVRLKELDWRNSTSPGHKRQDSHDEHDVSSSGRDVDHGENVANFSSALGKLDMTAKHQTFDNVSSLMIGFNQSTNDDRESFDSRTSFRRKHVQIEVKSPSNESFSRQFSVIKKSDDDEEAKRNHQKSIVSLSLKINSSEATTINTTPAESFRSQHHMLAGSDATNPLVKLEKKRKSTATTMAAERSDVDVDVDKQKMQSTSEVAVATTLRLSDSLAPRSDGGCGGQAEASCQARSQIEEPLASRPSNSSARRRRPTRAAAAAAGDEDVETVRALIGHRLVIPCAIMQEPSPATSGIRPRPSGQASRQRQQVAGGHGITLIVWHKDEQLNSPVFSVDARGASSLRDAKQQTLADSPLKGRAHLDEWRGPMVAASGGAGSQAQQGSPALVIDEASAHDGGVYTCTLEFYKAPTQTRRVRVLLVDPPRNMNIRHTIQPSAAAQSSSATDEQPTDRSVPFDEDSRVQFSCQADPGDPAGQIAWWQLKSAMLVPAATVANANNNNNNKQARVKPISTRPTGEQADGGYDDDARGERLLISVSMDHDEMQATASEETAVDSLWAREHFVGMQQPSEHGARNDDSPLGAGLALPASASGRLVVKQWQKVKRQTASTLAASGKIQSSFELVLSRQTLGHEYLCAAQNNDFSPPLNSTLKINLNLKPSEVRITNKSSHVFKMGQKLTIECQVHGSRPEPSVRWFKGLQELETTTTAAAAAALSTGAVVAGAGGNVSQDESSQNYHHIIISELNRDKTSLVKYSYLTFIPQISDNQQTLTCSAHNPKITSSPTDPKALTDSIVMDVQFPAQLSLKFGPSFREDSMKLDTDVYMDCNIQANPAIDELGWLHNGHPLSANASAGYVMSNQSLIIQRIRIEHRGSYQCVAIQNSLGKFYSNKLELRPKFEPVCDYSLTRTRYEVRVNQPVRIECNVLADPADDLHFVWKFNQSSGASGKDTASAGARHHLENIKHYETNFTQSYIMFTPKTQHQYGQFLCSASNSLGKQARPCAIQVVESELPDPVVNCFFDNQTESSLSVHCQSSAAPQQNSLGRLSYQLELYAKESHVLRNGDGGGDDDDDDGDSVGGAANTSAVHLKQQREQNQDLMMEENAPYDQQASDSAAQFHHRHQHQPQRQLQQVQRDPARKLSSETPTFHLSHLKPGTGYNLVIYVSSAKGRSPPYFYPVSTLAQNLDGSSSPDGDASLTAAATLGDGAGGKQIQFGGQDRGPASIWDKLTWPPSVTDYLMNGDRSKPLLSIGLALLLCAMSVLVVAFFVSRLCRKSTSKTRATNSSNNVKRSQSTGNSVASGSGSEDSAGKLHMAATYADGGTSRRRNAGGGGSQSSDRLADRSMAELKVGAHTPSRLMALAGSGSDTSRETNTDSTLISLFRPMALATGECSSENKSPSTTGQPQQGVGGERSAYGGGCDDVTSYRANQSGHNNPLDSPMMLAHHQFMADHHHHHYAGCQAAADDQMQQRRLHQAGVYSALKRSRLNSPHELELAPSSTPQVSIQSGGSDCASTNNELIHGNEQVAAPGFPHSDHLQLIKCHGTDGNLDGYSAEQPVYVIGRSGGDAAAAGTPNTHGQHPQLLPAAGNSQYTAGQLRLITESVAGGRLWQPHQQNSGHQSNSPHANEQHLTRLARRVNPGCRRDASEGCAQQNGYQEEQPSSAGSALPAELPIPISLLPNSVSIPVSLDDCPHLLAYHQQQQPNRRQLSNDILAENLCLADHDEAHNYEGSYLTLANHPLHHQIQQPRASSCCQPVSYLDAGLIAGYATTGRREPLLATGPANFGQDHCDIYQQDDERQPVVDLVHYCSGNTDSRVRSATHGHRETPTLGAELPQGQTVRFERSSQGNAVMNDVSDGHENR